MIIEKWGLGIGDWFLCPIPNPQSPNFLILLIILFDLKLNT